MTNIPDHPDLPAIVREAQVEITAVETLIAPGATSDGAAIALDTAELGYYEAELRSLRDAATTLDEAAHPHQ
jgi:hypothetical protein